MANFLIEKELFEKVIFFVDKDKKTEVCRISEFSDSIEVYAINKGNHADKTLLLEIEYLMNRDTVLETSYVKGDRDTLCFKGFTNLKPFKIGKTPHKIKSLFVDIKKSYNEVYTTCKDKDRNIYFSVRHLKESSLNEFDVTVFKEYFLVGAYHYDPDSIGDEVYSPLQAIYIYRIKYK